MQTKTKKQWERELDKVTVMLDKYQEKCRMTNTGTDRYQIAEYMDYIDHCQDQINKLTK